MNRIRSTIGESNFEGTGPRRFVVGEETQAPMPVQEINPAVAANLRRQAQEYQEQQAQKNTSDARRRIDIITGLGRRTKEVPVDDANGKVIFVLRTLKTFEQNSLAHVYEKAERIDMGDGQLAFSPTSLFQIKIEALSHSLLSIDGQLVDIILGTSNSTYENQVLERRALIEEMDHALINHLYANYQILTQETYDGYIPKTIEEAKAVVETISKSG
jgi:protein-tyrosine-phosphatase